MPEEMGTAIWACILKVYSTRRQKANGEIVTGIYLPILFESLTDLILSGREELGMPKLYTALDTNGCNESYCLQASW